MQEGKIRLERRADLLRWAEPRICAFDIETTKLPLQFPNSEYDQARAEEHIPAYRVHSAAAHSCLLLHLSYRLRLALCERLWPTVYAA